MTRICQHRGALDAAHTGPYYSLRLVHLPSGRRRSPGRLQPLLFLIDGCAFEAAGFNVTGAISEIAGFTGSSKKRLKQVSR
jgi:hypothetical protein